MVTKIVVPLDGTHLSLASLPLALKLTNLLGGQLCLLKVVSPVKENLLQKSEAEAYLENIIRSLAEKGNVHLPQEQVYSVVIEGHPVSQQIALEAHKQGATHILMTTHGRGGLSRLVLGSTALEIIRNTSLPVIFLRPERCQAEAVEQTLLNFTPYKELEGPIVITLDGSMEAEQALNPALELSSSLNLSVHLLRVLPPFVPVDELAPWYKANVDLGSDYLKKNAYPYLKEQAVSYLDKIQAWLKDNKGINCHTVLKVGEPQEEIIRYASTVKASFVVMATRAHGRIEQACLGSVASQVLCQSNFPVIMVNIGLNLKKSNTL